MITPSKINLSKNKKTLTVTFDETDYLITSEYLRVYSPSAEVQGHGPGQETLQLNKQNVEIEKLNPMGNYAISIHFSDGHTTGIYSWSYYTTYVLIRMNYGLIIVIELQIVAKTTIIKSRFNGLDVLNYQQKILIVVIAC